jgi:hypothetical protein
MTNTEAKPMTQGYKELTKAGFGNVKQLGTRERLGDEWVTDASGNVVPGLKGPARYGKWFECDVPRATLQIAESNERVLMLRQSRNIWHAFYSYTATASGGDPARALTGGLGDAIDTDEELKSYSRLVSEAPVGWADRFQGLSAAKSQVA